MDESPSILVVDDSRSELAAAEALLSTSGYRVFTCANADDSVVVFQDNHVDVVLTDIIMPGISGIDLLEIVHKHDQETPVILMSAYAELDTAIEAINKGAFDFLVKPYKPFQLLNAVKKAVNHKRLLQVEKRYLHFLEATVETQTRELAAMTEEMIFRLTTAAEYRDNETGSHIRRIGLYSKVLAESLGLNADFVQRISLTSSMHDIGKIGIPDGILMKKGRLTDEEREAMKEHTVIGASILSGSTHPIIQMAATVALTHHERWDGTGYPLGLKGESIPLEGRIVIIADQYDALTTRRPYKPAISHEDAVNIMRHGDDRTKPEHFDPLILRSFLKEAHRIAEIHSRLE